MKQKQAWRQFWNGLQPWPSSEDRAKAFLYEYSRYINAFGSGADPRRPMSDLQAKLFIQQGGIIPT